MQTETLVSVLTDTLADLRERSGYSRFVGSGEVQSAQHLARLVESQYLIESINPEPDDYDSVIAALMAGWLGATSLASDYDVSDAVTRVIDTLYQIQCEEDDVARAEARGYRGEEFARLERGGGYSAFDEGTDTIHLEVIRDSELDPRLRLRIVREGSDG
jgi:hypothetical protein